MKKFLIGFSCFAILLLSSVIVLEKMRQGKYMKKEIETIVIDNKMLRDKLKKEPPQWMRERIEKDLKAYPLGITSSMLDEVFRGEKIKRFNLIRFTIEEGHIAFAHDEQNLYSRHFRELYACIKLLNEQVSLPSLDFIVSLEDGFEDNPGLGPCFVFAKRADLESLILIPDIKALTGYGKIRQTITQAASRSSWEKKEEKAFWRGSTTGGHFRAATWDQFARSQLVLLSMNYPESIDARFSKVVQCDPEMPKMLKKRGLVSRSVLREDHLRYKYLVDVDGNSCSYERYFWLLLSNSLVIKQATPNIQWYYGGLEPYKHYLPVKEDLSDLLEQIEWARQHDDEARAMALRASQFVEENLSSEDILVYLYHLLQEYARRFDPDMRFAKITKKP
jgi:hypothetical protein